VMPLLKHVTIATMQALIQRQNPLTPLRGLPGNNLIS
jgi:hypothetical protein